MTILSRRHFFSAVGRSLTAVAAACGFMRVAPKIRFSDIQIQVDPYLTDNEAWWLEPQSARYSGKWDPQEQPIVPGAVIKAQRIHE